MGRKGGEPLVMLTAYTVRTAQLLDPHCDLLLVGDSLGQVVYGLPSTVPVTVRPTASAGTVFARVVKEWKTLFPGATAVNAFSP